MLKYITINSQILNETIILIFDKNFVGEARREHPGVVIYFPPEITRLYELINGNREAIKKVHAVKKEFTGWVVQ